jgi:hypothetical protein
LHAACPALSVRGLSDAVEQKVARGVSGGELGAAVSGEPGDLEIDLADVFLPVRIPKLLICLWFSLRATEAKSLMPLTVSPRLGVWPATCGIWNWLRDAPRIAVNRDVGSMIPET